MDLFKTFNVQLYQRIRKISITIKFSPECGIFYLHFGYAAPPFVEQQRNKTTLNLCCSQAGYHQLD
ncbi:hypothetical protein T08_15942 [Trichinella sp. T8]|nr:hypothetical protein T08_15942 [Trichinella sp. T8]